MYWMWFDVGYVLAGGGNTGQLASNLDSEGCKLDSEG